MPIRTIIGSADALTRVCCRTGNGLEPVLKPDRGQKVFWICDLFLSQGRVRALSTTHLS